MAVSTSVYTNAMDQLVNFRKSLPIPKSEEVKLQAGWAAILQTIQDLALNSADATARTYLTTNRKFVINSDGSDRVITYNSVAYTFTAGAVYCLDSDELRFFLAKATELGYGLAASTLTTWVGGTGVVRVFYW